MHYNANESLKCTTIILLLSFPGPEKIKHRNWLIHIVLLNRILLQARVIRYVNH
jgi:hypothetical protein